MSSFKAIPHYRNLGKDDRGYKTDWFIDWLKFLFRLAASKLAVFMSFPKGEKVYSSVFWVVTQRRLVKNRRFGTTYSFHLQGSWIQEEGRWTTEWNYKVKLSPSMPWRYVRGVEVYLHSFLTSVMYGAKWSTSRPGRFTPWKNAKCTHWVGGCVGRRAGMGSFVKRKYFASAGNRTPNDTVRILVTIPTAFCRLHR